MGWALFIVGIVMVAGAPQIAALFTRSEGDRPAVIVMCLGYGLMFASLFFPD